VAPPPQLHDLACVVHLHSTYSDGTGTVTQIANAARRSGADVVLLTDHDTLEAQDRGEAGWYGPVLVLVGEEVSPKGRDHYLAFDVDRTIDHRGLSGAQICEAVRDAGGFGFAAHPFSRGSPRFKRLARSIAFKDLDCDALEGIELWSFATDGGEQVTSIGAALRFVVSPERFLDHPPPANVEAWDRLCQAKRVVAIGGVDAHQFGVRMGPVVPLRLMSYRRSFRHIRTHVLCEEPMSGDLDADRDQVFAALRAGSCYLSVDSVASPKGFGFWAEGPSGVLPMGAEAPAGDWTLRAVVPSPARIRVLRDGRDLVDREAPVLARRVEEPGVYRVEAYRRVRGRERTWVMSNPIYLRQG
jgi:hypothetical protein